LTGNAVVIVHIEVTAAYHRISPRKRVFLWHHLKIPRKRAFFSQISMQSALANRENFAQGAA